MARGSRRRFSAAVKDTGGLQPERPRYLRLDRPHYSRRQRGRGVLYSGWLPGHIAKVRGHPWADAVTVAGWVTLICGLALWPIALIWAYVDVPAARKQETAP